MVASTFGNCYGGRLTVMSYNSIDSLFEMLSSNDEFIKLKGIEEAKKVKHLSVFLQPIDDIYSWESCAIILASKSDDELKQVFYQLFEWLKDMNWPGADIIFDRLLCVKDKGMVDALNYSLCIAKQTNDTVWYRVLVDFATIYNKTQ